MRFAGLREFADGVGRREETPTGQCEHSRCLDPADVTMMLNSPGVKGLRQQLCFDHVGLYCEFAARLTVNKGVRVEITFQKVPRQP